MEEEEEEGPPGTHTSHAVSTVSCKHSPQLMLNAHAPHTSHSARATRAHAHTRAHTHTQKAHAYKPNLSPSNHFLRSKKRRPFLSPRQPRRLFCVDKRIARFHLLARLPRLNSAASQPRRVVADFFTAVCTTAASVALAWDLWRTARCSKRILARSHSSLAGGRGCSSWPDACRSDWSPCTQVMAELSCCPTKKWSPRSCTPLASGTAEPASTAKQRHGVCVYCEGAKRGKLDFCCEVERWRAAECGECGGGQRQLAQLCPAHSPRPRAGLTPPQHANPRPKPSAGDRAHLHRACGRVGRLSKGDLTEGAQL